MLFLCRKIREYTIRTKYTELFRLFALVLSAPNCYSLPGLTGKTVESGKPQAPIITPKPRSKIGSFHEDLQKVSVHQLSKNSEVDTVAYTVLLETDFEQ